MRCGKAKRLIFELIEGKTIKHKQALEEHLKKCKTCYTYYAELRDIERLLAELPRPEPPAFLQARIKWRIKVDGKRKFVPLRRLAWAVLYFMLIILSAFAGNKIGESIFFLVRAEEILVETSTFNYTWEVLNEQ